MDLNEIDDEEMAEDDFDEFGENQNNELAGIDNNELARTWTSLKGKFAQIYDEDERVDVNFLANCYNDVFNYLMHVNRAQIESRSRGHQEFSPGMSHHISRDLYFVLLSFLHDKTEEFSTVS